nr:MAG TPA: hypothetical protein [Caudoviricetes sp.]
MNGVCRPWAGGDQAEPAARCRVGRARAPRLSRRHRNPPGQERHTRVRRRTK